MLTLRAGADPKAMVTTTPAAHSCLAEDPGREDHRQDDREHLREQGEPGAQFVDQIVAIYERQSTWPTRNTCTDA